GRSAFGRLPYTAQHTAWRCATSVPSIHTDGPCVSTGYVELHAHSNYSFLDGASDVEELVTAAVERGMDALALTDTNGLYGAVRDALSRLAGIFGERCYVELSDHLDPDDPALCDALAQLASEQGLGAVVTNNVHYARPEGRRLHDVLRCIEGGLTLDEAGN